MTSLLAVPPSDDTNRIPIVNLGNFLLRHTWSIQCLSEFGIPLDSSSLSSLEEEMTMSLRNQWASQGGEDCCGSWEEGSFVRLFWGKSQDDDDENDEPRRKKQKLSFLETIGRRNNDTRQSTQDKHSQDGCHHLLVDVTVQEEPSAQIACCFPQNTSTKDNNTKIQRFAFLLTRGSKRSLEAIWQCLETKTACRVAKSLFRPSIVDMTLAVTWWTSQHFSKFGKQQQQDDNTKQQSTTKPLTLVYQVPSTVAGSGLDSVSLMVPPVALLRLANDIVVNGKKQSNNTSTTDDDSSNDSSNDETVPLVLALQDFLRDTFKIRIERFLLTSASCSVAMLGRDGRCKPTCAELLDCALREIKDMVERRRVGNDNDSSTKANDRESVAAPEETAVA